MRAMCSWRVVQDAQAMFDSGMSAAAIVARVQELQAAAGIKAQLVNPAGRGAGIITLTGWVCSRLACSGVRVRPWMAQGGPCIGIVTLTGWVRFGLPILVSGSGHGWPRVVLAPASSPSPTGCAVACLFR